MEVKMPFEIVHGDVTKMSVDAVVNAANSGVSMGGGVCGAIFRAAGEVELAKACRAVGGCPTGQAVATDAFRLMAKCVVHAVGPVWRGGGEGEESLLASCYRRSLAVALERDCRSAAFPLISSGIYGYPRNAALHVAVGAIGDFLSWCPDFEVFLAVFGNESFGLEDATRADIVKALENRSALESEPTAPWRTMVEEAKTTFGTARLAAASNLSPSTLENVLAGPNEPPEKTLLALTVGLKLSPKTAAAFLASAGRPIAAGDRVWGVTAWFLNDERFNVHFINEALFAFGLPQLG
jgi:O-acetyl-ADP-ribose deacetylase (regulator of RNase III)